MIGIYIRLIHLQERVLKLCFFRRNSKDTPSMKGKSTIDAPSSGRQSTGIDAPCMKGKSSFDTPSMKDKSADLPREGKKAEKTSASIQFSREKFGD